jgi:hypothetical protein
VRVHASAPEELHVDPPGTVVAVYCVIGMTSRDQLGNQATKVGVVAVGYTAIG